VRTILTKLGACATCAIPNYSEREGANDGAALAGFGLNGAGAVKLRAAVFYVAQAVALGGLGAVKTLSIVLNNQAKTLFAIG
jgi:hypothetical protein